MSETGTQYLSLIVDKNDQEVLCDFASRSADELGDGAVTVRISHSSLNYKDALACTAHPGVAKSLPLVPGIDAAGKVIESSDPAFSTGEAVMIFHAKFGTQVDGGYSQLARVPADWVYSIPSPLTTESAMIVGTAGFTAVQCVDELIQHQVKPEDGPIVVSGATGGVGVFAVKLLAKLGYEVVASTGKSDRADWLKSHGATSVISREELNDQSGKPLLKGIYAGGVDTVGSNTLSTILRATKIGGCVTACGLAGGIDLPISVYPFILRGVTLQGVDTANIPIEYRKELWSRLANEWFLDDLDQLKEVVSFRGLQDKVKQILAGQVAGRTVVEIE
jgi:putative YhdH/YhfP family quinone oxidoreductase